MSVREELDHETERHGGTDLTAPDLQTDALGFVKDLLDVQLHRELVNVLITHTHLIISVTVCEHQHASARVTLRISLKP